MNSNKFIKNISGIILAGGKSVRMGEDKALKTIQGTALIEFTIKNIQPQVNSISINTNQTHADYQQFGYALIPDIGLKQFGPLSGIYNSLKTIQTDWAFFSACDTPSLPKNIVARLFSEAQQKNKLVAVVKTDKKLQPLVLLLHKNLSDSLEKYISSGERKTQQWILQQHPAIIDCSDELNAFININTRQDFIDFEEQQLNSN